MSETRAEYQDRARAYVAEHGRKTPTQIYEAIGDPPEGVRLAADGKGSVRARDVASRRRTQAAYNKQRAERSQPKGDVEAAYDKSMRRTAKQRSDNLIHQIAYGGESSIAEHNQPLHKGGDASRQSISEPPFKVFKDTVESKLKKYPGYTTDIDDVTGGVRVIDEKFYNKFEPTSKQPGFTLEVGDDIDDVLYRKTSKVQFRNGAARFPVRAIKYAMGPASAVFTAGEAQARQQIAKEDPTLINKVKAAISTGEAALDAAGLASAATGIGAVATPIFEGGSMILGFTNMVIEGSEDPAKISTKNRKRFRH